MVLVNHNQAAMVEPLVLLRSRAALVQPELQAGKAIQAVALVEQEVEVQDLAVLCLCRADIACWSIVLLPTIRQQAGWGKVLAKGLPAAFTTTPALS